MPELALAIFILLGIAAVCIFGRSARRPAPAGSTKPQWGTPRVEPVQSQAVAGSCMASGPECGQVAPGQVAANAAAMDARFGSHRQNTSGQQAEVNQYVADCAARADGRMVGQHVETWPGIGPVIVRDR